MCPFLFVLHKSIQYWICKCVHVFVNVSVSLFRRRLCAVCPSAGYLAVQRSASVVRLN